MSVEPLKANEEYVNIWDSCGVLGFLIPWAEWKCYGLLPTCAAKRGVDTKFVSLVSRESMGGWAFDLIKSGKNAIYLEDYHRTLRGFDWDALKDAIIEAARLTDCVLDSNGKAVGQTFPVFEDKARPWEPTDPSLVRGSGSTVDVHEAARQYETQPKKIRTFWQWLWEYDFGPQLKEQSDEPHVPSS